MHRTLISMAAGLAGLAAAAPAPAATLPLTGNWEGTGSHGLPLSFELASRHGRMLATNVALALPLSCPAEMRNTDAIPLAGLTYSDRDGVTITGRSGRFNYELTGNFSTPRSGTFSTFTSAHVGCGWPTHILTWRARPERRRPVADGVWRGEVAGPGVRGGRVRISVAAGGRVLATFAVALPCARGGGRTFVSPGVNDFITAGGAFRSPLSGQRVGSADTAWAGRFDGHGHLTGSLQMASPCGSGITRLAFRATRRG